MVVIVAVVVVVVVVVALYFEFIAAGAPSQQLGVSHIIVMCCWSDRWWC